MKRIRVPAVNPTGTGRRIAGKKPRPKRRRIAFGWYGGKFSHLDFILPQIPLDARHFCDVYGGSAAVLINLPPFPVETYNDIDSELVNFFRVLRDQEAELIRSIALTPFSREELANCCKPEPDLTTVERARRFFIRARQTRTGLAQTSSEGRWAHCVLTSRAGMAGAVSRWLGSVEGLPEIVQRLQRVQIENAPAIEVIQRFDTDQTIFYLDPPYVHSSRGDSKAYGFEMSDEDHRELAETLNNLRGRAVLSGYKSELYDEIFGAWERVDAPVRRNHATRGMRQESIWRNF
jgi:DNA adenine methylase